MKQISKRTFSKLTDGDDSFLIQFFSPTCVPCKNMFREVSKAKKIYKDNDLDFYKINGIANKDISDQYEVSSIPTLIYFKDGKEVDRIIGYQNISKILELIE